MKILLSAFLFLALTVSAPAQAQDDPTQCTLRLTIDGAIGAGAQDYIERGMKRAAQQKCASLLLSINTPGGSISTTRTIVERILSSPIPVLCLIAPEGAHAGSAGAYIMMACHVSGGLPATNLGAGTPITSSGDLQKDLRAKVIADTVSWISGLAKLRGRNAEFAEKLVTDAKAIDAEEAARIHAIDTVSSDTGRFLDFAQDREVVMQGGQKRVVLTGAIHDYEPDLRTRFLQFVADPEIAYLLFMASLALLYFEFTHTGAVAPGVIGGIGLMTSLIAFHFLEVRWGATGLITLGLGFLIAEAFVPSFGALGLGGVVALAAGSLLLYEPGPSGEPMLSPWLIGSTVVLAGGVMMALAFLAFRAHGKGPALNENQLLNQIGEIASLEAPSLRRGMIIVNGEYWRFHSGKDLQIGDSARVLSQQDLELHVEPAFVQATTLTNRS